MLSASTGEQSPSFAVSVPGPHGMALDEANGRLFAACDASELAVLDPGSGGEISNIPIPGPPDVLWLNPRCGLLYFAFDEPGVIDVINTKQLSKVEQAKTSPVHTLSQLM